MTEALLLIRRSLRVALRQPAAIIPNVAISVFFLFVYNAGLNAVENLPGFEGSYLAFILPVAILSAAVGGAGVAGQELVRDLESGYFSKLLLTPAHRLSIVWGPMVAAAILLVGQVVLILVLGLIIGLHSATGVPGLLMVVVFAFLWGMAFAGYAAFAALRFKNAAAAQAATLAFFPLLFLSSTFVPLKFLDGWLKVAATINPTTYVFEGMRAVLMTGWNWRDVGLGLLVVVGTATLTGALAVREAVRSTKLAR